MAKAKAKQKAVEPQSGGLGLLVIVLLVVYLLRSSGGLPNILPPSILPTTTVQAATYVYEKDDGEPSPGVMKGLDRLNREKKVIATVFEDDSTNGLGQVPTQYRAAVEAARVANGPALVVTGTSDKVLNVVKSPTTEAQVWEAVP